MTQQTIKNEGGTLYVSLFCSSSVYYEYFFFLQFCSSQRSIKRKRFDDEIVTYSLGLQPGQVNRVGRARRQSQTFVVASPSHVSTTIAVNTPPQLVSASVFTETVVAPSTPQLTSAIELTIEEPKPAVSKLYKTIYNEQLISIIKIFKAIEASIPSPSPTQSTATNSLATAETVQIQSTSIQTPQILAPAVVPSPAMTTTATPTIIATTDVRKKNIHKKMSFPN